MTVSLSFVLSLLPSDYASYQFIHTYGKNGLLEFHGVWTLA